VRDYLAERQALRSKSEEEKGAKTPCLETDALRKIVRKRIKNNTV
jgi:hypothetical protein